MSRTISPAADRERHRYLWVTTTTAAARIGGEERPVSKTHIVRLIEAGKLRARNVAMPGGKRKEWRIDPASIEEFLDSGTTGNGVET